MGSVKVTGWLIVEISVFVTVLTGAVVIGVIVGQVDAKVEMMVLYSVTGFLIVTVSVSLAGWTALAVYVIVIVSVSTAFAVLIEV